MIPDKVKLEEIIKELQKIMRIQDWDIDIEVVSRIEMNGLEKHFKTDGECDGINDINRSYKTSHIYIIDKEEDWYWNLIHELIHLVNDELCDYTSQILDEKTLKEYEGMEDRNIQRHTKIFCKIYPVTNFIKEAENVTE
jgi:hypothetical protein